MSLLLALLLAVTLPASSAVARPASSAFDVGGSTKSTDPNAPVPVVDSSVPPAGRRLSARQVLAIAAKLAKAHAILRKYRGAYPGAYLKGPTRWQVSYFSRGGKRELLQILIDDASGKVTEQWTGFQIPWTMARGYPGAFGKHVNALYVWLPMCLLFALPFLNWRRPFSLIHLDVLMLLSFSASLAFFNRANIYASVPLTYPPLVYLLVRMLALARVGRRVRAPVTGAVPAGAAALESSDEATSSTPAAPSPAGAAPSLRLLVPIPVLAIGVVFLIGFRIGLNVTDSNVIDVGYAGVIGAQRIVNDKPLYGGYPADNEHGDTYGPVAYESYIPFQQIFGWSGRWDDLPAAHGAAILFDLLAAALMFLLGRRVRGPGLGIVLAYAWVSFPFTLFALESNSNDVLVSVLVLAAVLAATSAPARGAFAALAGLAKFAPLALAPLMMTHGLRERAPRRRPVALLLFLLAFAVTAALVLLPAIRHDTLHTIYQRTLAYQSNRGSPFSAWGLYGGLGGLQSAVQIAAIALALGLALLPRRPGVVGLSAVSAAVLIATQLGIDHWFYLYIPWFFGLVMVALLGSLSEPPPQPAAASESARSTPLAVGLHSAPALP
jgi:hypothetical protein